MREVLDEQLGEINEYMGSVRDAVKAQVPTEPERRKVYQTVLTELLEEGRTGLKEDELLEIIKKRGRALWSEQED